MLTRLICVAGNVCVGEALLYETSLSLPETGRQENYT